MFHQFHKTLSGIDGRIGSMSTEEIQRKFEDIPLEIFGKLMIERPQEYPNLMKWLPPMPSVKVQESWTGNSGNELMRQSVSFIRIALSKFNEIACVPPDKARVLDFGCGWGRLIRLLYKYFPVENIYGVDPWTKSIDLCREARLYGNIFLSDYLPVKLPVPGDAMFDFIIAFSVFSHLSERAAGMALDLLCRSLKPGGVLVLTIRPREYWAFIHDQTPFFRSIDLDRKLSDHDDKGFAFFPHVREKVDGDITYGEASMSLEYLVKKCPGLRLSGIEWSGTDPMQIIVILSRI